MRVSTKYSPQSGENSSGTTYRQLDRRSRRPDTRVKLMESQWVRGWPGYFRLLTRVSFHLFSFIPPFSFPPFPFNFLRNTCTMERGRLSTSFRVERAGSGGFRRGLTDKKRVLSSIRATRFATCSFSKRPAHAHHQRMGGGGGRLSPGLLLGNAESGPRSLS